MSQALDYAGMRNRTQYFLVKSFMRLTPQWLPVDSAQQQGEESQMHAEAGTEPQHNWLLLK